MTSSEIATKKKLIRKDSFYYNMVGTGSAVALATKIQSYTDRGWVQLSAELNGTTWYYTFGLFEDVKAPVENSLLDIARPSPPKNLVTRVPKSTIPVVPYITKINNRLSDYQDRIHLLYDPVLDKIVPEKPYTGTTAITSYVNGGTVADFFNKLPLENQTIRVRQFSGAVRYNYFHFTSIAADGISQIIENIEKENIADTAYFSICSFTYRTLTDATVRTALHLVPDTDSWGKRWTLEDLGAEFYALATNERDTYVSPNYPVPTPPGEYENGEPEAQGYMRQFYEASKFVKVGRRNDGFYEYDYVYQYDFGETKSVYWTYTLIAEPHTPVTIKQDFVHPEQALPPLDFLIEEYEAFDGTYVCSYVVAENSNYNDLDNYDTVIEDSQKQPFEPLQYSSNSLALHSFAVSNTGLEEQIIPISIGDNTIIDNNDPRYLVQYSFLSAKQKLAHYLSSYLNDGRNLYALCFSLLETTFYFNYITMQWSRSTEHFIRAWVSTNRTYRLKVKNNRFLLNKDNTSLSYSDKNLSYDNHINVIGKYQSEDKNISDIIPILYNGVQNNFFTLFNNEPLYIRCIDNRMMPVKYTAGTIEWDTGIYAEIMQIPVLSSTLIYDINNVAIKTGLVYYLYGYDKGNRTFQVTPVLPVGTAFMDVVLINGSNQEVTVRCNYSNEKTVIIPYGYTYECKAEMYQLYTGIPSLLRFNKFQPDGGKVRFFEVVVSTKNTVLSYITIASKNVLGEVNQEWDEADCYNKIDGKIRYLVPKNSSVGNFLQISISHSTPQEVFNPTAISLRYQPFLQTNKITNHNDIATT
jgi:hypothetical protein